jgi:hypothetical protein
MSAECPNGHGRQCIITAITADGSPAVKASDVIANKLACGCTVGGPDYEKFQENVNKLKLDEKKAITAIREKTRQQLGTIFRTYTKQEAQ